MELSMELISQFAKVTQTEKKTKNEVTVHGVIVKKDGVKYVKLDGSDSLTPVKMTVDAEEDERVLVLLKNHTATVTGNLTSPSARTATVQIIGEDVGQILATMVHKDAFDAALGRISDIETIIDLADIDSVAAMDERVDALETALTEHVTAYNELKAEVESLKSRVSALDGL